MTASVVTRSYDFYRTGANDEEVTLSASAVRARGIAKLFSMSIPDDPRLEAQPLAVGNVRLSNGETHDVIYQASMGNTVYAFDAQTGNELWKTNLGRPIVGTRQIDAWLVNVAWGILSTPVIDEAAGILYACAWISSDGTAASAKHFLAALRISDGSLARPLLNLEGAVYAPPDLPQQKFASAQRKQRAALTLSQGHVLIPFGTIAESASTARGWLIAVDVTAWRIAASWCSTVTGSGGGIWHSGAGPAVAADGSIFVVTGNGAFQPDKGDYGESIVKLTLRTGAAAALAVDAWWTPWSDAQRSGSAGEMDDEVAALPSNVHKPRVLGHAKRLARARGRSSTHLAAMDFDNVFTGSDVPDPQIAAFIDSHIDAMMGSVWDDQDFFSGCSRGKSRRRGKRGMRGKFSANFSPWICMPTRPPFRTGRASIFMEYRGSKFESVIFALTFEGAKTLSLFGVSAKFGGITYAVSGGQALGSGASKGGSPT
jgi:hypothetical protein